MGDRDVREHILYGAGVYYVIYYMEEGTSYMISDDGGWDVLNDIRYGR